jgi:hypothetical protein
VNRVREVNADRLRQEFAELKFKLGEGVEDFSLCITPLTNQLRVLGDNITDKEVVKKLLHSVPEKLEQVANSMETLLGHKPSAHGRAEKEEGRCSGSGC